jgi:tol-pal system protein YbgF
MRTDLGAGIDSLLRSQADLLADFREVGVELERLQAQAGATREDVAELTDRVMVAQEEVSALHEVLLALLPSGTKDGSPAVSSSDPEALYRAAYSDFLRGSYAPAIASFKTFLEIYPNSDLADNALYWIAESYFSQGQYRQAIDEFARVLVVYPTSEREASALLRQGYAWIELGDRNQGRRVLRGVIDKYPRSDEAILAQRQLDTLDGNS